MTLITKEQLDQIMPIAARSGRTKTFLPYLLTYMNKYDITTPKRVAAFLAQIAHESGEMRFLSELWGPTQQQKKYEPPGPLANRLGNTEPGDGFRYRGRGLIQLTGRFNYSKYSEAVRKDYVSNPNLVAELPAAVEVATWFWKTNKLNDLADKNEIISITRKINGGTNGLSSRREYYERALRVLGDI